MIVWKNGDSAKIKWMIEGAIQDLTIEEYYSDKNIQGVVFYQFGRHIAYDSKTNPEPIIDRRALTAFFHFIVHGKIKGVQIKSKDAHKIKDGKYIVGNNFSALNMEGYHKYINWFKRTFKEFDDEQRRHADIVMFGIGRELTEGN